MHLLPLVTKLYIQDKDKQVLRFTPNSSQLRYLQYVEDCFNAGIPARAIILKARQMGFSTATEAIIFCMAFIFEGMQGLVVAHSWEGSQHLLSMTQRFWETYPFASFYNTKYESKNTLSWKETGSSINISTARNVKGGRGRTLHALHASEVAVWDNPQATMLALNPAIPYRPETFIALESTAHGVGNYFYDQWNAAVAGDIDYKPLFFPWHEHDEYRASYIGLQYNELGALDAEEKTLRNIGISDDRLAWRRHAIKDTCNNDLNFFHQEYPTTAEEAFVSTGTNVFPMEKLFRCYDKRHGAKGYMSRSGNRVTFVEEPTGPLTVFRKPNPNENLGVYCVGGDPTHTTFGDYACAQVINRRTFEQVATWRAKKDPLTFAEELCKLGIYYNQALLVTESTGPGYGTIGRLLEMDYPKIWRRRLLDHTPGMIQQGYGWQTSFRSKAAAVGFLLKLLVDEDIKIHDTTTFSEMRDYVTGPDGQYQPASEDGHDDTVMALAIACIASALDGPLPTVGGGGEVAAPDWVSWGEQERAM